MSDILGIAASAAGGGLFGLLGTIGGRVAGYFETKQKHAQERASWDHEAKLHELNRLARSEENEQAIALAATQGSWDGLRASLDAEAAIAPSYKWVDAVRALVRPTLTVLLWIIGLVTFFFATDEGRASWIETITFASTAATLWWFGDRAPRGKQ